MFGCCPRHRVRPAGILHGFGFGLSTSFCSSYRRRCHTGQPPRRRNWLFWFRQDGAMMALARLSVLFLLHDINPATLFFSSAAFSFLAILVAVFMPARAAEVTEKASLRDRICETGTGPSGYFDDFFGAAYGNLNTYIAMMALKPAFKMPPVYNQNALSSSRISRPWRPSPRCQRRFCNPWVGLVFDRFAAHHGCPFTDGLAGSVCLQLRCRPAAPAC